MIRLIGLRVISGLLVATAAQAHDPDEFRFPTPVAVASKPIPRSCEELADPAYSANTAIKQIRDLKARCDAERKPTEQPKLATPEVERK